MADQRDPVLEEIAPHALIPLELTVSVAMLLAASVVTGDRAMPATNRLRLAWLGVLTPGCRTR